MIPWKGRKEKVTTKQKEKEKEKKEERKKKKERQHSYNIFYNGRSWIKCRRVHKGRRGFEKERKGEKKKVNKFIFLFFFFY